MTRLHVLFVCLGNSCRSPMAEAIARGLGGDRVVALSAGISPAGFIAEPTRATLRRLGYSDNGLFSKGLDAIDGASVDVVVSLLGGEFQPGFACGAHTRRLHWPLRDPFGEDDSTYLSVAREIEDRVRRFLDEELSGELLPV